MISYKVNFSCTTNDNLLPPGTSIVRDCPPQDITVPFKSSGLLTVATILMVDELNSVTFSNISNQTSWDSWL